jgi:lipopolysaccharide export LptBFGC system permease protein LptF
LLAERHRGDTVTRRRKILVAAVLVGAALAAAVSLLPERSGNAVTSGIVGAAVVVLAADFITRRKGAA